MRTDAILALFSDVEKTELTAWIERGWVQPEPEDADQWVFHDIDVARVQLIHDLRRDLEVSEESVPLVLSLLDQVYELRWRLRTVLHAIKAQPQPVQEAVIAEIKPSENQPG